MSDSSAVQKPDSGKMRGGWIQTFSGHQVWLFEPDPGVIDIHDIAHHLAIECRYTGATAFPYSVAQHSVLVSERVEELVLKRPVLDHSHIHTCALQGLLHDAAEAYLKDIPSPWKKYLVLADLACEYSALEDAWTACALRRFGLSEHLCPEVKKADAELLATEAAYFFPEDTRPADWRLREYPLKMKIERWTFEEAKERFLQRFQTLGGRP